MVELKNSRIIPFSTRFGGPGWAPSRGSVMEDTNESTIAWVAVPKVTKGVVSVAQQAEVIEERDAEIRRLMERLES